MPERLLRDPRVIVSDPVGIPEQFQFPAQQNLWAQNKTRVQVTSRACLVYIEYISSFRISIVCVMYRRAVPWWFSKAERLSVWRPIIRRSPTDHDQSPGALFTLKTSQCWWPWWAWPWWRPGWWPSASLGVCSGGSTGPSRLADKRLELKQNLSSGLIIINVVEGCHRSDLFLHLLL